MEKSELEQLSGQMCLFREPLKKGTPASPGIKAADEQAAARAVATPAADTGVPDRGAAVPKNGLPGAPYGLNTEQWAAVSAVEQAVAVMAGPGTGKTKTLVARIAYWWKSAASIRRRSPRSPLPTRRPERCGSAWAALWGEAYRKRHADRHVPLLCLKTLSAGNDKNSVTVIGEEEAVSIMAAILQERNLPSAAGRFESHFAH